MIQIIFENEHFVVCDKPSGVLSTPGRPHEKDDRSCLGTDLQEKLQIQIYPVHRLDFEVSGLVLYAKNPKAHAIANSWFEEKTVRKTYRAWTLIQNFDHIPRQIQNTREFFTLEKGQIFEWKCQLLRGKKRSFESPHGKLSVTKVQYLGVQEKTSYLQWDLNPVTGRSHQLRYELSRHGFPIIGDFLYGSKENFTKQAIALRSYRLDFLNCNSVDTLKIPKVLETSLL